MNSRITAALAALLASVLLAACGSSSTKTVTVAPPATQQTTTEADQGGGSNHVGEDAAKSACKGGKSLGTNNGLPAAFPAPGELVLTQKRTDGPSKVVDGYWTAGIDEAYREFRDQIEQAGYKILFNEHEKHDAEISYSGSGRTGQIALREDCTEAETTRVHITNRPQ